MTPPRFPPAVLHADEFQLSLLVDCASPACMVGVCEVIIYTADLTPAQLADRLRWVAETRGLCDLHQVAEMLKP
jgi:hypothetical protein